MINGTISQKINNGIKKENILLKEKGIFLTPECYRLWTLRTGFFLLYDYVIIDKHDYDEIHLKQHESTYDYLVYKNTELLKKEGYIKVIDYSKILTEEKREDIHKAARNFVSKLSEKELIFLSAHAHREYELYLKNVLSFCHTDEPKYQEIIERIEKMRQRMELLNKTGKITEEHIKTLERITAKIVAGMTVVSNYSGGILHDTNEYKPFFEKYKSAKSVDKLLFVEKNENLNIRMIIAAVFNKPYPVIEIYDEKSFYELITTRREFDNLRNLIAQMEKIYGELLDSDKEKVFQELKKEINSISNTIDQEFQRLKNKFYRKIIWGILEEIGAKFIPLFKILLDPLLEKNDELIRKEIEKKIINKDTFGGNLYLLYKKIKIRKPHFALPKLKHYDYQKSPIIWGEKISTLPWYERGDKNA